MFLINAKYTIIRSVIKLMSKLQKVGEAILGSFLLALPILSIMFLWTLGF